MTRRIAFLLVLLAAPAPAVGQAADCTYDRCALRVRHGFWSDKVVKGADEFPVSTLGLFATPIEPLASAASDSVRRYYRAFQTRHTEGGVLLLVGVAVSVGGFVTLSRDYGQGDNASTLGLILLTVGLGFEVAGGVTVRLAREQLSHSIWLYNRDLSR